MQDSARALRPLSSGWFEDMLAGHPYHEVDGNFFVTARMRLEGTRADAANTLLARGLFVRAPRDGLKAASWKPGRANRLFFAPGSAFPAGAPQFEVKTIFNSRSTLRIAYAAATFPGGFRLGDERCCGPGTRQSPSTSLVTVSARRNGSGPVVLVGYSLGGVTLNTVGEAMPELLRARNRSVRRQSRLFREPP